MMPIQRRENAANAREGCGCLLVVAGVLIVLFQLATRSLWLPALRLGLVASLGCFCYLAWVGYRSRTGEVETESSAAAQSPVETGWSRFRDGDPFGAWETAKQILAVHAEEQEALQLASLAALASGDAAAGLAHARALAALAPGETSSDLLVRLQLAAGNQWEAALAGAPQDPDTLSAGLDLLVIWAGDLWVAGATDTARVVPELAQRLAPSAHQTHRLCGELAYVERRWQDAEAASRRALAGAPKNSIYFNNLAVALTARWRFGEAWRYLNHALRLDPSCQIVVSNLEGQLHGVVWVTTGFFSLLLGVAGMIPTLTGQLRNDWMPWATFAGPVLISLLIVALQPLERRVVAPALPPVPPAERSRTFFAVAFVALLLLLALHALQAWLEIALHPALFGVRWQSAATLTFLALPFFAVFRRIWPR